MSQSPSIVRCLAAALLALGAAGSALAAQPAPPRAPDTPQATVQEPSSHAMLPSDERTVRHARSHARTTHGKAGLAAARAGTGASAVAAEKSEHMPVPKTGM
ncbi:MAG TPA: hypothetical protein VLR71_13575 [Casimicrobiaceae bacterium]|nr:hypothetical protein [Casimicrobiaceae bacterium]